MLFEFPGWLGASLVLYFAHRSWGLSSGLAWTLLALWIAKDFALYPVFRGALADGGSAMPHEALVGATGVVTHSRGREGYLRVGAELWRFETMRGGPDLAVGRKIRVREVRGLTLIVEPFASDEPGS